MSPQSSRLSWLKPKSWSRSRNTASQADEPTQSDSGITSNIGAALALPIFPDSSALSLRSFRPDRFSRSRSPHIRSTSEPRAEMTADVSQTNSPSVQAPTTESIAAIATLASPIGTNSLKANASQPEHLWDVAYDELKESHPKLIQLYEAILSRKLLDYNFDPSEDVPGDNQIEQGAADERRDQMRRLIEAGQEKKKRENKIKSGMKDLMNIIMPMKGLIRSTIQAVPQAALPWAIVCVSLEILQNPLNESEANANGIRYVVKRMEWYWDVATDALNLENGEEPSATKTSVRAQLVELYQELLLFQIKSVCSYYRSRGLSLLHDVVKLDDWAGHLENIRKLEADFTRDYSIHLKQKQTNTGLNMIKYLEKLVAIQSEKKEIYMEEQGQQCIRDLRITNPRYDRMRIMDAKGGLLWDSYRWVLESPQFQEWRDNEQTRLLWIKGDPGKGKTMLLCGLLQELEQSAPFTPCLSYFFCQGTDQRLNNANAILRGLIYMLVIQQPSLVSHIQKEHRNADNNSLFNDINAWFTLSEIFENILQDPVSKIVVIDALDECESDRKKLLDLIVHNVSNLPHIKWIISSRNFNDIENKLDTCPSSLRLGLEVNADTVSEAVASYIRYRIPRLGLLKNNEELQNVMCGQMLEKANGTFLWAALVFKELQELEDSIAEDDSEVLSLLKDIPSDLTELYHRMMKQINELPNAPFKDKARCFAILSTMALAYEPIQLIELPALIGLQNKTLRLENVAKLVQKCGSFLTIRDGTIYFIHQSAKDYLVGAGRDSLFKSDYGVAHREIFGHSLNAMSSGATLRRNMYSLSHPGVELHEITAPDPDPLADIRYSCIYGLKHFCESFAYDTQADLSNQTNNVKDVERIHQFFKSHLLNWLEALSLMKQIQSGIVSIQTLIGLLKERSKEHEGFEFFEDAARFILYNRFTVEQAPLQTYVSALMFSPMKSIVRVHFEAELSWIKTLPTVDEHWSSCIQTLYHSIYSFSLSSDAKLLAATSFDGTVKVWDVATWESFYTLKADEITAVSVLSFGDSVLLVLSSSRRLRLRDVTMDKDIWSTPILFRRETLEWKPQLSSDSKFLAVDCCEYVQILDITTGKEVQRFHSTEDWDYAKISKDFRFFVEELRDKKSFIEDPPVMTRNVIEMSTGESRHTFETSYGFLFCFSEQSKFFAFQQRDLTISVRDIITNDEIQTFGCATQCNAMAFEGDTKLIFIHSAITIWDVMTGQSWQKSKPLDFKTRNCGIIISRNYELLISRTQDSIQVWDIGMMAESECKAVEHPQHENAYLALSNDAKLIALSVSWPSKSTTIRSANTGKVEHTLLDDGDFYSDMLVRPCIMTFSNDSRLLATMFPSSSPESLSVSLWSTETGKEVHEWQIEDIQRAEIRIYNPASLEFSHDSTLMAVGPLYDGTIRVWDTKTGQERYALRPFLSVTFLRPVAFSYDSKFLAVIGERNLIYIWSLEPQKFIRSVPYGSGRNDIFFDNTMLCMATDLGYVGLEGLDSEGPPILVPLQPKTTRLFNERYTTCKDSKFSVIYWNAKKLIWLPREYRQKSKLKATAFTSSSSVIKISTDVRGILTIEFYRPRQVESENWTPWRSSPLFREISDDSS